MKATLLVSKKTYSLAKRMPVIEWHEKEVDVKQLKMPNDFEVRAVEAALYNRSLEVEFTELKFDWCTSIFVKTEAEKFANEDCGLTDIALFVDAMKVGIVYRTHRSEYKVFKVNDISELKSELA